MIIVLGQRLLANLREASTGGEFLSALTFIGLAVAQFTSTPANTSFLVLLFGAKFALPVIVALLLLAFAHLVCLMLDARMPMVAFRKLLSFGGMLIWGSLTTDLVRRGQYGGMIIFFGLALLLWIAVWRGRYA